MGIVIMVVMTGAFLAMTFGCDGLRMTGEIRRRNIRATFEIGGPPKCPADRPCAEVEIDGQTFLVYCDENCEPKYYSRPGSDRRLPIDTRIPRFLRERLRDVGPDDPDGEKLESNQPLSFELNGATYSFWEIVEDRLPQGTADELLAAHGLAGSAPATIARVPIRASVDERGLVTVEVFFRGDMNLSFPDPALFDGAIAAATCLTVSGSGGPDFGYHVVQGTPGAMARYAAAMDGFEGVTIVNAGPAGNGETIFLAGWLLDLATGDDGIAALIQGLLPDWIGGP